MDSLTVEDVVQLSEDHAKTLRAMVLHDPSAHQIYVIGQQRGWDDARIMRVMALHFFAEYRRTLDRQVEQAMREPRLVPLTSPPSPPAR